MKIGIMTFHASYNCGSILQCLALKTVLEAKGEEVTVINFSNKAQQQLYSVFYKKLTLKNIIKNFLCIPGKKVISDHFQQYKSYIDRVFQLSGKPYSTSDELRKNLPHYDLVIAGGDQVWNTKADDFDKAYFLDFADSSYKISYSPSLGATDITQSENKDEYKKLLENFKAISCREVNGKKWLEALTGREVELLLDPTLLLNQDQWLEKIDAPLILPFRQDYIFYYAFSYSPENNEVIQRIAEEENLKVVVIDSKQWYIKGLSKYKNFVLCEETGPNAFLNLMDGAKYVATTSFHGTVFSLIFHKKFIYINTRNHEITDDRTSFLLEQLGLMTKYLYASEVTIQKLEASWDYSNVDNKIDILKLKAHNFLDRNIGEAAKKF